MEQNVQLLPSLEIPVLVFLAGFASQTLSEGKMNRNGFSFFFLLKSEKIIHCNGISRLCKVQISMSRIEISKVDILHKIIRCSQCRCIFRCNIILVNHT